MILADTINNIRRKVLDWFGGDAGQQVYTDEYYEDAINFAISRLNSDLDTAYTIDDIPADLEWVIILLATIEMASIRAVESSDSTDAGSLKRLELDGYESEFFEKQRIQAKDWIDLIEELEDRYDDWLDTQATEDIDDAPETVGRHMHLPTLRKAGAYDSFIMDRGVAAPVITLVNAVTYLNITWSAVYDKQFDSYKIRRKLSSGDWDIPADVTTLVTIADNHTERYKDTTFPSLAAGTYNYRMVVTNKNGIERYDDRSIVKA